MATIKVLPEDLINKIAAGEIVERPASVVRELVENALDAGADEIRVRLEEGGRQRIAVSDNGCGMSRDDALMAFERHATSKLHAGSDLSAIASLGFRGEALPSIAAVSKLRLRTRAAGDQAAVEVNLHAGKLADVRSCAWPAGSEVEVLNLFYNTPARREFLKSVRTEELRVKRWLGAAALAFPKVHFKLVCDERETLNLPPRASSLERARDLFSGSSVGVDFELDGFRVGGLLAHPAQAQAVAEEFILLVNQRVVQDRLILRAVKDGFGYVLKPGEYPLGFISLLAPLKEVDVNVHPQKSEVRFRQPQKVFVAVREASSQALRDFKSPAQAYQVGMSASAWRPSAFQAPQRQVANVAKSRAEQQRPLGGASAVGQQAITLAYEGQGTVGEFKFSRLQFIGQFLQCYLLCQDQDRIYVVDMHAAHERYNYNIIRRAYAETARASQQLLVPEIIELGEQELENLKQQQDFLQRVGFECEFLLPRTVRITATPAILTRTPLSSMFAGLAAFEYAEAQQGELERRIDGLCATLACHASVRSGDMLKPQEVQALFQALDSSDFSAACPHGRPVVVSFTRAQVESWFGRDR